MLNRRSLREQIRDEVITRIENGQLPIGADINEAALADDLGVSRTPLREALVSLEASGVLHSSAGKGFQFVPYTPQEFVDAVGIVADLESMALRTSRPEDLIALAPHLLDAAGEITAEEVAFSALTRYDDTWHALMISPCPNHILVRLIGTLKLAMHRFESTVVSDQDVLRRSAAQHTTIARRLGEGQIDEAIAELRRNWQSGCHEILTRTDAQVDAHW